MQPEKRKLGKVQKFFVCPECGVREQQNQPQESSIIKVNLEIQKDDYYGESEQDYLIELSQ